MEIDRFEDIQAWQESRNLTRLVYESCKSNLFAKDFGLKDQIQRALVSTMANIAEGFDSASDVEFIKFLVYSRRFTSEVQSHLYVALDQKYITDDKFIEIYDKCKDIKCVISGFIKYLKKT